MLDWLEALLEGTDTVDTLDLNFDFDADFIPDSFDPFIDADFNGFEDTNLSTLDLNANGINDFLELNMSLDHDFFPDYADPLLDANLNAISDFSDPFIDLDDNGFFDNGYHTYFSYITEKFNSNLSGVIYGE